ncbi:hypothetical protein GZH53_05335 [Flavihumibacter sp. R14]|nr:hypothetical protein [Flavihumibacter soli]
MKKLLITVVLLTVITAAFGQSKKKSPLYGTWILESAVFTTEDSVFKEDNKTKKQMKIITPDHFMFIISNAADNKFVMASGGRAIITDDTYTEIIDYSSEPDAVNKTYKFTAKVVGDKYYQSGTVGNWKLEEVWKKSK